MTEDKEEKKSKIKIEKVRVPDELLAELRLVTSSFSAQNMVPPRHGDLLWEAWQEAKAAGYVPGRSTGHKGLPTPDVKLEKTTNSRDFREDLAAGNVDTGLGLLLGKILRTSQETLRAVKAQGAPHGESRKTPTVEQEGEDVLGRTDRETGAPTRGSRTRNRPRKTDVA